jgi:very-short-patch-repair endonuclease
VPGRPLSPETRALVDTQRGVLGRGQALASGLTDAAVRAHLRAGRWQRALPGVYATFTGPLPWPARCWAALLYAGDDAVLSHDTAAALQGLAEPALPVHVTVPARRRVRPRAGLVVVHHSQRLEAARHPSRLPPRTRVEDTVLDLAAASARPDDALAVVADACRRRVTTAARLAATAHDRPRLRRRAMLLALLGDVAAGAHSVLEVRFLWRVERPHGIPTGTRQRRVPRAGGTSWTDVAYERYRVAVELDGRRGHESARDTWRDLDRDNMLALRGEVTLRFGWRDVLGRPCAVATQVGHALRRGGWTGSPHGCGPGCTLS